MAPWTMVAAWPGLCSVNRAPRAAWALARATPRSSEQGPHKTVGGPYVGGLVVLAGHPASSAPSLPGPLASFVKLLLQRQSREAGAEVCVNDEADARWRRHHNDPHTSYLVELLQDVVTRFGKGISAHLQYQRTSAWVPTSVQVILDRRHGLPDWSRAVFVVGPLAEPLLQTLWTCLLRVCPRCRTKEYRVHSNGAQETSAEKW